MVIAGCSTSPGGRHGGETSPHYKIGNPYKINGRWYRPAEDPTYDRTGVASWYGHDFHGRPTANGEIFDMNRMTAAHTTLPLPSMVEVTNLDNGRRAVVRVNDRGPFAHDRIIDLSRQAARELGFEKQGLAKVRVRFLAPAPLPGSEERMKYAVARPAPIETPPPVAPALEPAPASADADDLAAIIAGADPGREPNLPPPLETLPLETAPPDPALYLVQVALLDDIEELPTVRARLADEGPLRIARANGGATPALYRINLGPFDSETQALNRLEAIREAGYDDAEIVILAP